MNTNNIKDTRYCKKCNENLPKTIEFFPQRKTDKSGFGLYCKGCLNKEKREKRSEIRKLWDKGGIIEGQEGRKCTICKIIYPENNEYFGKHKGNSLNLDTYCKICRKEKGRANYHKNKDLWNKTHNKTKTEKQNKILEIKKLSSGCSKCGEKRPYLLDFHHLFPDQKLFQIAQGEAKGWGKVLEEMKKCILMCKNCHAEFHYLEKQTKINIQEYINLKNG
jgi:Zn finger protein HypA/HybF involved in hydrogenase expression